MQVPSKSMVVNILGQVLTPATVVYDPKLSYKDYVNFQADLIIMLIREMSTHTK